MEKIIIANDSTIENVKLNFEHFLPDSAKIRENFQTFKPLETLTGKVPENFFPSLLTSRSADEALKTLSGNDELELFFMLLLSENESGDVSDSGDVSGHVSTCDMLGKIIAAKESTSKDNYLNLLLFLLLKSKDSKQDIISEIKQNLTSEDPVANLLLSFYDESPHEIAETKTTESLCASFFEALKAEKSGDFAKAFSLMLNVFEESGFHTFIFEILKFYIMQYNGIPAEKIAAFVKKVTENALPVSLTTVKFVEFIYYYKNNISERIEETVSVLAENTDSVFILNIIAPLLHKYKKWHFVGKFYKLASKKAVGAEKTVYLELLADIYENKLELPDFADEIYKTVVEEDPMNCTFALAKTAVIYEKNESWEKLAGLYLMIAEKESDPKTQAAFFYKAGEILHQKLHKVDEARDCFEKSITINYSFETARVLAGIYLSIGNYEKYKEIMRSELNTSEENAQKIRILERLAAEPAGRARDYNEIEKYLLEILKLSPKNINALKRLGKIYYSEKKWEQLAEINFKEIDISKDISEIINLYYKNGVIFYENIQDLTRATECFREVLDINPEHLPTLFFLEKIYARTKDLQGLIFIYSQISDLNTNTTSKTRLSYLTRLAMIFRDNGQSEKAEKIFMEILKNYPDNMLAKENSRMLKGVADFTNIETQSVDYNECNFELLIEYIKQKNSTFMTDEILKREEPSFWKELYFLYREGIWENVENFDSDREKFVLGLLENNLSIDLLVKNSSKKIALFLLALEYIKAGFFEGVSIILNYYLKFEPGNKRKIWSLFFKGCGNPELKDNLEELLIESQDQQTYNMIREILEHIYIQNGDYKTAVFIRNLTFQKITDNEEKCRFLDKTIELLGENISPDQLINLYKNRIKFTSYENLDKFFAVYEKSLTEIGHESLLIPLYEQKWNTEKENASGKKLIEIFTRYKDWNAAKTIAEEFFGKYKSAESLDLYLNILIKSGDMEAAENLIKNEMPSTDGETKTKLRRMLFDIMVETGRMDEAYEFFGGTDSESTEIEGKIEEYISTGNFETAEKSIDRFVSDTFRRKIFLSKIAKEKNETEEEKNLLESILFDAVLKKEPYPLKRIGELNANNQRLGLFINSALNFIGDGTDGDIPKFPNIFTLKKDDIFNFAGFGERDYLLKEFVLLTSSTQTKTKVSAKPLHSNDHRILVQLVEYIKLSCGIEELEGLWDEKSDKPYEAVFSNLPYIVFGQESLKTDFEKLKFYSIRDSFLLSCGITGDTAEIPAKITSAVQLAGRDKIKFVKSIKNAFQPRVIELLKLLENIQKSEIESFLSKIRSAAFFHAFSIVPDIEEAQKQPKEKIEKFLEEFVVNTEKSEN